ncbi:hypothetical protein, conserved [Eimeria praecox]|uniref:Uncharacterized protein n=1 Tax=Eimeria praecox TaxID=51316 RepID=U6G1H5_9EIME|nr:hypothetical protein, conserved [Eimeria praecox]
MEVDKIIPSQFVYPPAPTDFGSAEMDPPVGFYNTTSPPAAAAAAGVGAAAGLAAGASGVVGSGLPGQMSEFVYPSSLEMNSSPPPFDAGGPWAQKGVFVRPSTSSTERMHTYGKIPPRGWIDHAKEWLNSFMEGLQERQQQQQQQQLQQQLQQQRQQQLQQLQQEALYAGA